MAKAWYRGEAGVARKVIKPYRGEAGVARKVTTGYRGVDGVARIFFDTFKWDFVTEYGPNAGYPNATITVYDLFSGWDGDCITMRADAKASRNDQATASAAANLYGDFTAGGTLNITWKSSKDPVNVDKLIVFYGTVDGVYGEISREVLPQYATDGQVYTNTCTIPQETAVISFCLLHHSTTRSSEYFTIDGLVINGETFV